jgi:hypothetical protein
MASAPQGGCRPSGEQPHLWLVGGLVAQAVGD